MRIGVLSIGSFDTFYSDYHLLRDVIAALLQRGHEVVLYQKQYLEQPVYPKELEAFLPTTLTVRNFRFEKPAHGDLKARYLADLKYYRKACRAMRKDALDCLYLQSCNTAFLPIFYARRILRLPVFYNEQDLFPDNALLSGALTPKSLVYRVANLLQRYAYKHASCLSTISPDMQRRMSESYGIAPERIHVIGNWGHEEQTAQAEEDNPFLRAYPKTPGTFRVIYAGNIGKMQNVELVVQTAALMRDYGVAFEIIGGGAEKAALERLAAQTAPDNVRFLPMQPAEMVADLYAAADLNVIPLKQGIIQTALPSKLADCLRAGRPIVTCFDADALFCAEAARYGIPNVPPNEPEALRQAILEIRDNGYQGRNEAFLQAYYRRDANTARYCELICGMTQPQRKE